MRNVFFVGDSVEMIWNERGDVAQGTIINAYPEVGLFAVSYEVNGVQFFHSFRPDEMRKL